MTGATASQPTQMASSSGKVLTAGKELRQVPDWIDGFLDYTGSKNSPHIFRLWAAISTVAGALERRVWTHLGGQVIYPALYVMLISPPGVGKTQAIRSTGEMWHACRDLKVAPDSMTRASFIDELTESMKIRRLSETDLLEYSALNLATDELGTLISGYELDFISVFNKIYDQPAFYRETRRTKDLNKQAPNPIVNMISGTQPSFLASLLPEEAWGMGFMARQILVYCADTMMIELFPEENLREHPLLKCLQHDVKIFSKQYGPVDWTEEAKAEFRRWYLSGMEPKPTHSKLAHYSVRRHLHLAKLSLVAAVSRCSMTVELSDLSRARDWMIGAEQSMPDIFRAMVGKSDQEVLQELHLFAFQTFNQNGRKPIHSSLLIEFLSARVPSEKVEKILDIADKAKYVCRIAGTADQWRPMGKGLQGSE